MNRTKITVRTLAAAKAEGTPLVMLTAYDASFARRLEEAGVDIVLVGDSLGNVVQGRDSTLPVTVDDIVYHTACVKRGLSRTLLVADMPFMSCPNRDATLDNAARLMRAGAEMVKLEGAGPMVEYTDALSQLGVPVCAHLGLTPQHIHRFGGMRVQGRGERAAAALLDDARALQAAGAGLLVLECVPADLAAKVAEAVEIPVIGIGAGGRVDGQVLVLYDLLGITPGRVPKFTANYLDGGRNLVTALSDWVEDVRRRRFPGPEHEFE